MTGQQLIDYIQSNNLQDANVTVTATVYRNGDHDYITTDDISLLTSQLLTSSKYDRDTKKHKPILNIYVYDNLY